MLKPVGRLGPVERLTAEPVENTSKGLEPAFDADRKQRVAVFA
jgi:hypothetical protein